VLTFNAYRGGVGVAPLSRLIQAERPDVLCLQEVGPGPRDRRRGWRDLRQDLPAGWRLARRGELAIATRLPVTAAAWVPLSRRVPSDRHHDRDALRMTVHAAGRSIEIVTAHLSVPTAPWLLRSKVGGFGHWRSLKRLREEQTASLLTALRSLREPLILAGDLNSTPGCRAHDQLTARRVDAFAAAGWGWGFTFPASRPLLRLDYILADPRLLVAACRVVRTTLSDHRPLIAEILLPAAPPAKSRPSPDSPATSEHGQPARVGAWAPVSTETARPGPGTRH
jgi:endonuclease/exonuclease/phosphatase family metal-dependent hydrolase